MAEARKPALTISEQLFQRFCETYGIPCQRIPAGAVRTPDFRIRLRDQDIVCEVKQIDPNAADDEDIAHTGQTKGRLVPHRVRQKMEDTAQLRRASEEGFPTLFIVYDHTPLQMYTDDEDVVTAILGGNSVKVTADATGQITVSNPFFGDGQRSWRTRFHGNPHVSAIAVLDTGPLALRLYHNPDAALVLPVNLFTGLPVTHPLPPGATSVTL
jgi:hypothetical protein